MSLTINLTTWKYATSAAIESPTYMALAKGEVMSAQVHPNRARVRVITGQAWISYEGQDYFLSYGEELTLPHGKYDAIITALYNLPLTLEWLPG